MRKVKAIFSPNCEARVHVVTSVEKIAAVWKPELRFLVQIDTDADRDQVEDLRLAGLDNLTWIFCKFVEEGDVVVAQPHRGEALVLLRESDTHHALFMTNRCNSNCLMCSQPPTPQDNSWLVEEAIDAIRHLRTPPAVLGLTGGEPLLLRSGLRRVIDATQQWQPATQIEVLTNGRLFENPEVCTAVLDGLGSPVRWLVPLYGHADFIHDFVVQTPGAFDETLAGLLELQRRHQPIQLRVVLIEPVLQILPELAGFIGRNLPFVREVALMGCEPIGFALANRSMCEVDLSAWGKTLERASREFRRYEIPHLFMNLPLCSLPAALWPLAQQSISDWKNVYAEECEGCERRSDCTGLFAWHERGWKPSPLRALNLTETME